MQSRLFNHTLFSCKKIGDIIRNHGLKSTSLLFGNSGKSFGNLSETTFRKFLGFVFSSNFPKVSDSRIWISSDFPKVADSRISFSSDFRKKNNAEDLSF